MGVYVLNREWWTPNIYHDLGFVSFTSRLVGYSRNLERQRPQTRWSVGWRFFWGDSSLPTCRSRRVGISTPDLARIRPDDAPKNPVLYSANGFAAASDERRDTAPNATIPTKFAGKGTKMIANTQKKSKIIRKISAPPRTHLAPRTNILNAILAFSEIIRLSATIFYFLNPFPALPDGDRCPREALPDLPFVTQRLKAGVFPTSGISWPCLVWARQYSGSIYVLSTLTFSSNLNLTR